MQSDPLARIRIFSSRDHRRRRSTPPSTSNRISTDLAASLKVRCRALRYRRYKAAVTGCSRGPRYVDGFYATDTNTCGVPLYVVGDAELHDEHCPWRWQINAVNFSDKTYVALCQTYNACFCGDRRRALFHARLPLVTSGAGIEVDATRFGRSLTSAEARRRDSDADLVGSDCRQVDDRVWARDGPLVAVYFGSLHRRLHPRINSAGQSPLRSIIHMRNLPNRERSSVAEQRLQPQALVRFLPLAPAHPQATDAHVERQHA